MRAYAVFCWTTLAARSGVAAAEEVVAPRSQAEFTDASSFAAAVRFAGSIRACGRSS